MRPVANKQSRSTASSKDPRRAAVKKRPRRAVSRPRAQQRAVAYHMPLEGGAQAVFDPDLRHRMISEAAYYLYSQRGYAEGYDLDDWLQAEAQIDDLIMNPEREDTREVSAPLASP